MLVPCKLRIKKFMTMTDAEIDLPAKGVVMITGKNGTGKSSVCEAITHALWNKSIRHPGNKPTGWVLDTAGSVDYENSDTKVQRRVTKKGTAKLKYEGVEAATQTKLQQLLSSDVGEFEEFKTCSVITSKDRTRFTQVTDVERKKTLSKLMGFDRIDAALKKVKVEAKELQTKYLLADGRLSAIDGQIGAAESAIENQKEWMRTGAESVGVKSAAEAQKKLTKLRAEHAKQKADIDQIKAKVIVVRRDAKEKERELRDRHALLRSLEAYERERETKKCERCGQNLPDSHELMTMPPTVRVEDIPALKKTIEKLEKKSYIDELQELQNQLLGANTILNDIQRQGEDLKEYVTMQETAQENLDDMELELAEHLSTKAKIEKELKSLKVEAEVYNELKVILGPRGVRTKLMGDVIYALNQVSNKWIRQIAGSDTSIRIAMEDDKVTLDIEGYANGSGYYAMSLGQQTRVDLAIAFALSEVMSSRSGRNFGICMLDEVLHGVDDEGVEAAVEAIRVLGQKKCVLVITHNIELKSQLAPAIHLHAEGEGDYRKLR